jgi:hypothetical protein
MWDRTLLSVAVEFDFDLGTRSERTTPVLKRSSLSSEIKSQSGERRSKAGSKSQPNPPEYIEQFTLVYFRQVYFRRCLASSKVEGSSTA